MRIYDFPKYPKTQNPKTFASCKLFLKIIYKSLTALSQSCLGGREGRLGQSIRNPQADGLRGRSKDLCVSRNITARQVLRR